MHDDIRSKKSKHPEYLVLDGIRGIAALAVVLGHLKPWVGPAYPPSFFLAVDLFFMMSGFVIALAYHEKLGKQLSFPRFALFRFIRLFPMYIFGTLLGAYVTVAFGDIPSLTLQEGISSAFPTLLMLPVQLSSAKSFLFPYNPIAWSLFFELIANLAYAGFINQMRKTTLAIICAACFAGCLVNLSVFHTLNVGATWNDMFGGVPRVGLSFFAGILIQRLHISGAFDRINISWIAIIALTSVSFWINWHHHPYLYLWILTIAYPAIIIASVQAKPGRIPSRVMSFLALLWQLQEPS